MHCWPRYILWSLIAILGIGNMITACGQKGPLYLPKPDSQQEQKDMTGK
jgi:predicted small lipoprotein YifL